VCKKRDRASSFKKKPGKGGTPLNTKSINNQFNFSSLFEASSSALGAALSPPIKYLKVKKTIRYIDKSPFHFQPPKLTLNTRAPKKKIEEVTNSFLACLIRSPSTTSRVQPSPTTKVKGLQASTDKKYKGMIFWRVRITPRDSQDSELLRRIIH